MIPHINDTKGEIEEEYYDDKKANHVSWQHQLLLNRPLKVVIILLLASVLAPLMIYYYIFFTSIDLPPTDGYSFGSCLIPRESRLLCGTGYVNESNCHSQCCFDLDNRVCFHRFPSRFTYITTLDQAWDESMTLAPRVNTVPYNFQTSLPIRLTVDEVSSTHLSLSFNKAQTIYHEGRKVEDRLFSYEVWSPELNIIVNGTRGNNTIFNSMRGPIIASDDIWEMSFVLTNESMYGLGEIPLKANATKVIYNNPGGLSSIPLIFAKSGDQFHGLLIDVLEPTELKIQEDNKIVVRSITMEGLKFHLFVGPHPKDVMKDVTEFIGSYEDLEYWMLGAHVCSEGSYSTPYKNLEEFLEASSEENFHFDSHCGNAPMVFENKIVAEASTSDANAEVLKKYQKKFVPHVSPYVRFEADLETAFNGSAQRLITADYKDFLLRGLDGDIYVGEADSKKVVYPDYQSSSEELIKSLWPSNTEIDGVVLENSWPSDDSAKELGEAHRLLPYFSENFEEPFKHTPLWNIDRPNGEKYFYTHNAYGNHFAKAFEKVSEVKFPISTSSQWMNGKVVVNKQNIDASWANLQKVLTEAALGGISGHRLWSSPICGDTELFDSSAQTNLCVKWYLAATYLPMIKIHSKAVEKHPLAFVGTSRNYMLSALKHRASLLPYFFTILQEGPLLRPMFYQFPASEALKDLASQFSVGDDLLIVPNLLPSQSHVHVWLPPGTWYELWSGFTVEGKEGQAVTMTTTEADLLSLIRGGSIVTLQKDVQPTSEKTRAQSNFSLIIALDCGSNETLCEARGRLFISKDATLIFTAEAGKLLIEVSGTSLVQLCDPTIATWAHVIKEMYIYGLAEEFNNYDNHRKVSSGIDLCALESEATIVFSYAD